MGEHGSVRRGVLGRARGFVTGRPTSQKVGGGVAAALLASAPFGGLAAVEAPTTEPLRLDQAFRVGPYEIVIDKVVELPDLKPAISPEEGQRVIVLDATVTNTTDRPDYSVTLTNHITVDGGGVKVEERPSLVFVDDSTDLSILNPGVGYRTAICFVMSGPWQGDAVTVRADHLEFIEVDSLTLDPNTWREREGPDPLGTLPFERKS